MSEQSPSTLYRNGAVYSWQDPYANAMLVVGERIAWLGSEEAAENYVSEAEQVVDLAGAVITPGMVDSHVHLAGTGANLESLDLSRARSANHLLELVDQSSRALAHESGTLLRGHSWDETLWESSQLPSSAELQRAGNGVDVYLERIDAHSALVSAGLIGRSGLGAHPLVQGALVQAEARAVVTEHLTVNPSERRRYHRAALAHAAENGIVAVVENASPLISGLEDAVELATGVTTAELAVPEVQVLYGQAVTEQAEVSALQDAFAGKLAGLAGDLNVDGSLGSRTALLRQEYADQPGWFGHAQLSEEQVYRHLQVVAGSIGLAGFHVIGDGGTARVLAALERLRSTDPQLIRKLNVRLEHAEMFDDAAIGELSKAAVHLSMQPQFDALWGGPGQMYEQRLGERSTNLNRFSALLRAGVPLVLVLTPR